jgi:hypothetical protein
VATDAPLPVPETEAEAKAVADIEKYGWHCILVADELHPEHAAENAALPPHEVYDAAFAYTVGLWRSFGHPELILVGRWRHAHGYLAAIVDLIADGRRFDAGDVTGEVLDGFDVRIGAVSDDRRLELLTWADWANHRRPFEALQVILPDTAGRWPEDPLYDGFPQPLLGGPPQRDGPPEREF